MVRITYAYFILYMGSANLDIDAEKVTHSLDREVWENFHIFLRAHTDILTKNVYSTKDDTWKPKTYHQWQTLAVVPKIHGDHHEKSWLYRENANNDWRWFCYVYTPTTDNTLN